MAFAPVVDAAIWNIAPGFRALSLRLKVPAKASRNAAPARTALEQAVEVVHLGKPAWAEAHLLAWADVFRRFGAKPQRTPCSAQSLRDRVLKAGTLGAIDPVVDLYNAISLKFAVPVGGENLGAYQGVPALVVANGTEIFDTMKNGAPVFENPATGEVVWRDEIGVTCRIWNWRQGVRTRIDATATDMWFVLESLPEMPLEALEEAGDALQSGLSAIFAEAHFDRQLLQRV